MALASVLIKIPAINVSCGIGARPDIMRFGPRPNH